MGFDDLHMPGASEGLRVSQGWAIHFHVDSHSWNHEKWHKLSSEKWRWEDKALFIFITSQGRASLSPSLLQLSPDAFILCASHVGSPLRLSLIHI